MTDILDWVGRVTTALFILQILLAGYAWLKGALPALLRLGFGLSRRKIAILARGEHLGDLKTVLLESKLFNEKNMLEIPSLESLDRADRATLFLVFWPDWSDYITKVLEHKKSGTALVVYAPQDQGLIPPDKLKDLNSRPNVVVANFRGRLLNDILVCMMTTSYA